MENDALTNIRLLRLPQVLEIIPISKSSWWDGIKKGRYPRPFKLSPRCSVWSAEDVYALVNSLRQGQSDHPRQWSMEIEKMKDDGEITIRQ